MSSTHSDTTVHSGWREFTDRDAREDAIASDVAATDLAGAAEPGF
jgi:hypothetical protein